MALLSDTDVTQLEGLFADQLKGDVTLVHFTQKPSKLVVPGVVPCPSCGDALRLLEELSATSDRVKLETHDFAAELDAAAEAGVDKIPATVVKGPATGGRVRYFGLPAGYEFASLIEDIIEAGSGAVELEPASTEALAGLERDIHIQVFATPT